MCSVKRTSAFIVYVTSANNICAYWSGWFRLRLPLLYLEKTSRVLPEIVRFSSIRDVRTLHT